MGRKRTVQDETKAARFIGAVFFIPEIIVSGVVGYP